MNLQPFRPFGRCDRGAQGLPLESIEWLVDRSRLTGNRCRSNETHFSTGVTSGGLLRPTARPAGAHNERPAFRTGSCSIENRICRTSLTDKTRLTTVTSARGRWLWPCSPDMIELHLRMSWAREQDGSSKDDNQLNPRPLNIRWRSIAEFATCITA